MNLRLKKIDYTQRCVDVFIIGLVWAAAFFLRFKLNIGGEAQESAVLYAGFGLLLTITSVIVFKNSGVYDNVKLDSVPRELFKLLKANFISFIIFLVIAFFITHFRLSRIYLIFYFVFSSILLSSSKIFFRSLYVRAPVNIILVGGGSVMLEYFKTISSLPHYKVKYWVDRPKDIQQIISRSDLDYGQLEKGDIDTVVVGYDNDDFQKSKNYLEKLSEFIIPLIYLPDLTYSKAGYSIRNFKGQAVFYINQPDFKGISIFLKRLFDFSSAVIGTILISPLLIVIALWVKLSSKGPVFYSQIRTGLDGKDFKMWKFRSMVTGDANHQGWTVKDDPRVTKVGRFIRQTSLDELPQLFNVITGDMSLVGPRPERPEYVEKFRREIPGYMVRHKLKAGITGWAQINGWRGDTSIEKRIDCDLWYIRNWSFGLDISILFMTFFKGFVNKNAY